MSIYGIIISFIMCFYCQPLKGSNVNLYVYDPDKTYTEAIVLREHAGVKEFLKCHPGEPAIVQSFKTLDKFGRNSAHYAALIEDADFFTQLATNGVDVKMPDIFGYSAEDYINKKHCFED